MEQGILFDFYGPLLTRHQQEVYSAAVYEDLSLSEVAEQYGITRQGVHDLLRRCDRILKDYEEKLGLVAQYHAQSRGISALKAMLTGARQQDGSLQLSTAQTAEVMQLLETMNGTLEDGAADSL